MMVMSPMTLMSNNRSYFSTSVSSIQPSSTCNVRNRSLSTGPWWHVARRPWTPGPRILPAPLESFSKGIIFFDHVYVQLPAVGHWFFQQGCAHLSLQWVPQVPWICACRGTSTLWALTIAVALGQATQKGLGLLCSEIEVTVWHRGCARHIHQEPLGVVHQKVPVAKLREISLMNLRGHCFSMGAQMY